MNIFILGYYHSNNLGDDLFEVVFRRLLSDHHLTFGTPGEYSTLPKETQVVILGGGDVLNDYFLDDLQNVLEKSLWYKGPVYGIGMGIGFPSTVDKGYLDLFDYIILRSKSDVETLQKVMKPLSIDYFPDLVFTLCDPSSLMTSSVVHKNKNIRLITVPQISPIVDVTTPKISPIVESDNSHNSSGSGGDSSDSNSSNSSSHDEGKMEMTIESEPRIRVGTFFMGSLYSDNNWFQYWTFVKKMASFLDRLTKLHNCSVTMFAFDTSKDPKTQKPRPMSDLNINIHIKSFLKENPYVVNDTRTLTLDEMQTEIQQLSFTVCMKYHAHILSFIKEIPCFSIAASRKVKSLLDDAQIRDFAYDTYRKFL